MLKYDETNLSNKFCTTLILRHRLPVKGWTCQLDVHSKLSTFTLRHNKHGLVSFEINFSVLRTLEQIFKLEVDSAENVLSGLLRADDSQVGSQVVL